MNREIKFRGKRIDNGEWVYGFLVREDYYSGNKKDIWIIMQKENDYEIHPKSVGQYTGFKDSNGNEIYEGDILSDWNEVDGKQVQSKMQVFWCNRVGGWKLDNSFKQDKSSGDLLSEELADFQYEVTGNIHEQ